MITSAVFIAFLSGIAWSGLDVARKSLTRDLDPPIVATGLTLGMIVLFGGWAMISSAGVQPASYVVPGGMSIVLTAGVQLLILESMRRSELSRTIPLLSMTPVATMIFGLVVLGEMPSRTQWLGVVLVFVGALGLLVSRASGSAGGRGGSALMLAAALLISAAAPFDKLAVVASSVAMHGFLQSTGVGLLMVVFIAVRGDLARLAPAFRSRPALLGSAFIAVAAIGFQYTAYSGAMVGVVETIKRVVGLVGSLVAGRLIFRESITTAKLAAIAAMAAGVTLMLL